MIDASLLYTRDHEWVRLEGDTATMGITDYAQEQLGEITFLELPQVGLNVTQRQEIGMVESAKAASDIYSPLTGEIVEVNQQLEETPELITQDCYRQGWICKIKTNSDSDAQHLMNAEQYEQYVKGL